ncbi:hypothetical protein JCM5350_004924 [Sporobolomyces pararoseus]
MAPRQDRRGQVSHSKSQNNRNDLFARARQQANAASATSNQTAVTPQPQGPPVVPAIDPHLITLRSLVEAHENVVPITQLHQRILERQGPAAKKLPPLPDAGEKTRISQANREKPRYPTFNKNRNPGETDFTPLRIRKEIGKLDALAQILENYEEYPELGDDLEARRSLIKKEMMEVGQSCLLSVRNRFAHQLGTNWEMASLVQNSFPDGSALHANEQILSFLEICLASTREAIMHYFKGYIGQDSDKDVPIDVEFETLARVAKLNEWLLELLPRHGADVSRDVDIFKPQGCIINGRRHGPPSKPFYRFLLDLLPGKWKKLMEHHHPQLKDWFNGKGVQGAAVYDVEASAKDVWHWDETRNPVTRFSDICLGPTPEGHSILVKRYPSAKDEYGPYYLYRIDKDNNVVEPFKKGGPELILRALLAVTENGAIPAFAFNVGSIDELVVTAAAWLIGGLVLDGKLVEKGVVPDLDRFKGLKGGQELVFELDGVRWKILLLNFGRIVLLANRRHFKQKYSGLATLYCFGPQIPGLAPMVHPALVDRKTLTIPNFEKALDQPPNAQDSKCSLDIHQTLVLLRDIKNIYLHCISQKKEVAPPPPKRARLEAPVATSSDSSTDTSLDKDKVLPSQGTAESSAVVEVETGKEEKMKIEEEKEENPSGSLAASTPDVDDEREAEEVSGEEKEDGDNDEKAEDVDEEEEGEDLDEDEGVLAEVGDDDGSISKEKWLEFNARWKKLLERTAEWVQAGRPADARKQGRA